ncbi:MAG: hypothetical protein OER56_17635, partial [Hyphomicrobiales bacterium]|nr:hypothetical protein [Hyphomicrobiales bacterium]
MFKNTLLTLTALSAVSLVVTGITTTPTEAAVKHRIKFTHAVKVKPNVKVKVNSKVRVKTVRPKIRVKIDTNQLAKSRVPSCRRYYAGRCRQAPANATAERKVSDTAVAKLSTSNTADITSNVRSDIGDRFPGIGNDTQYAIALSERAFAGKPWETQSGHPTFASPNPAFAANADRFANMKAAFEAGEAMKE